MATIKRDKPGSRDFFSYLMMSPFLIFFVLFTVLPIAASVVLSFSYFNMLEMPSFVGLENYLSLFLDDDVFIIAVRNTMIFGLITGPVGFALSFLFAWLINELGRTLRSVLTLIFYAPSLAGNLFVIWLFIFSGDSYGMLNGFLLRMGLIHEPVLWLQDARYNLVVVLIVMLWMSMGAGFLALTAGLQTTDKSLAEAAAIDGVKNRWQELWMVIIPQMGPQMMFGAILTIANSFAAGMVPMILTGFPSTDYSTHTMVVHIYDFGFMRYEMGYACAIAVVLFTIMIVIKTLITKMLKKFI